MSEIKRVQTDEFWADSTVIEAGDYVFVGYCMSGEGKPIDSKQKWAAVYWYLRWQCNYPVKGSEFCERIQQLPFTKKLDPECDYNNIRRLTTLSFMSQDARNLEAVKPSKIDEPMFAQCRVVVNALAEELEKASADRSVSICRTSFPGI